MPNWVKNTITVTCSDPVTLEAYFNIVGHPGEQLDFNKIIPMPPELEIESGSRTDDGLACVKWYAHPETPKTEVNNIIPKLTPEQYTKLLDSAWPDTNILFYDTMKLREKYEARGGSAWDDVLKLGQQACSNILTYGIPTWYEWRRIHWGTKWNADSDNITNDGTINFTTAWSAPMPIINKIIENMVDASGLSGTVRITHTWADENIGYNCGRQSFTINFDSNGQAEDTNWWYEDADKMGLDEAIALANAVWGCEPDDNTDDGDNEQGT